MRLITVTTKGVQQSRIGNPMAAANPTHNSHSLTLLALNLRKQGFEVRRARVTIRCRSLTKEMLYRVHEVVRIVSPTSIPFLKGLREFFSRSFQCIGSFLWRCERDSNSRNKRFADVCLTAWLSHPRGTFYYLGGPSNLVISTWG